MGVKRSRSDSDCESPPKKRRESTEGDLRFKGSRKEHLEDLYHQGELLGEGGFGAVYAGTRKADGFPVAIKYARKDDKELELPGLDEPIPLEVALMMLVSHESSCANVLKLLDWFSGPEDYIMILERPDPCQDLYEFCYSKGGYLSEDVARHVLMQVLQALRHCQDSGVFHRDLKTENLLIRTDTLEVKLIDFGCGDKWKDTPYVEYSGTEDFAPPELFLSGEYLAGPTTVWSVGVTLYELVCGYLPFRNKRAIISGCLIFPSWVSPDCCSLIRQCLRRKVADRLTLEEIQVHPWLQQTTNRSTEDAIAIALHIVLSHLDHRESYRMLFIDLSSTFNTIIPDILIPKLHNLGLPPLTCSWIKDFLTIAIKKAQQHLHFLRVLRKNNISEKLLVTFYCSTIESILT
ncbi:serine/threonine-protein kinase pim-1-like [Brienomyrus brachyistius]|uniref:serine/threonine-protein kinase pim-1-like n=2 Tax=Brienomyrus brachyistius TaxID=42636 RepID=UPI0020B1A30E|nr:serine/threonine-protein kinase pim-1-like [Brienomyrus brachyistius]